MPAQHRHDLPSRLGEQRRRSAGQLGDAEPRQAVLARAEDLALAAKGQIHLGELEPSRIVAIASIRRQASSDSGSANRMQ